MEYTANTSRYENMTYRRIGDSGLFLPEISLGLWHNFGGVDIYENAKKMILYSFDQGITHFDLANNYGPPPGSAEENFGRILNRELKQYRDEMVISTKAGYRMWPGPYGNWGSRKYLISSLDQSLQRMGLDYVDIFYHHRLDSRTKLEETLCALDSVVKQGKALYIGISRYDEETTEKAIPILNDLGTPFIIEQQRYSMFDRWLENKLLQILEEHKKGCIVFSPLAQGLLTEKYLRGIPENSRAAKSHGHLREEQVTREKLDQVTKLKEIANRRNQSISQLAISWILRHKSIASVLIGASNVDQIKENLGSLNNKEFSTEELKEINQILM
ncbi:MAG: aldo/keto reductase [Bacteroidales bacterium]|nr:aldo/keto reductase [Bacteroidales bacterium]